MRPVHNYVKCICAYAAQLMRPKRSQPVSWGLDSLTRERNHTCMERTIFCVQPYHRTRGGLVAGHMRRLLSADAAMKAARGMRGCADGVIVFSRTGSWEVDYWREPRLLARAGDTPSVGSNRPARVEFLAEASRDCG